MPEFTAHARNRWRERFPYGGCAYAAYDRATYLHQQGERHVTTFFEDATTGAVFVVADASIVTIFPDRSRVNTKEGHHACAVAKAE